MVSGGSLVSKDVPPYIRAAHLPLSYVGPNIIGLRRRGFSVEQTNEIHNIFRVLFQNGYAYSKACDIIEREIPQSETRDEILAFVYNSQRGILKPYNALKIDEEAEI